MSKPPIIRAFASVDRDGTHAIFFSDTPPRWEADDGQWVADSPQTIVCEDKQEVKALWPAEKIQRCDRRELAFDLEGPLKIKGEA